MDSRDHVAAKSAAYPISRSGSSMHSTSAIIYRVLPVTGLALAASLMLGGCSGGSDAMTQPTFSAPAADLDTTKAPPQTVTSMPLLPPVPDDPAKQPATTTEAPPLQYDHLYSDDEQTKIRSDLIAAAARAGKT